MRNLLILLAATSAEKCVRTCFTSLPPWQQAIRQPTRLEECLSCGWLNTCFLLPQIPLWNVFFSVTVCSWILYTLYRSIVSWFFACLYCTILPSWWRLENRGKKNPVSPDLKSLWSSSEHFWDEKCYMPRAEGATLAGGREAGLTGLLRYRADLWNKVTW